VTTPLLVALRFCFLASARPPKEQKPSAANRSANGFASSPAHAPRHVWAVESAATERTDARLVKRVVLLRLFYGGEMQKCDVARLAHEPLFFSPHHRNHVALILFKAVDERRPPSPPAPNPPLRFGLRVVQNPRSLFFTFRRWIAIIVWIVQWAGDYRRSRTALDIFANTARRSCRCLHCE
jgi:hypothetical protein